MILDRTIPRPFHKVHECPNARYFGLYGGRGSGKSHFIAEEVVEEALKTPGYRLLAIREVQKSLDQSAKFLIETKIRKFGLQNVFRIMEDEIRTPGGGLMTFQGMQNHNADSVKSFEGYHAAWIEEAHGLSQFSLKLLYPTLRLPGSKLYFTWNPRSPMDAVDKFFRVENVGDPDFCAVPVSFRDNPWFMETPMYKDMMRDKRRDPETWEHVWNGGYETKSEARVFRNWIVRRFEAPEGVRFYLGADWGFGTDPTVLVRCFIIGRNLYIDYELHQTGVEIDYLPHFFDQLVPGHRGWARKWKILADSSRPDTISYMNKHGYPNLKGATKGANSLEDGVEFLQNFDNIVVHPRCVHTGRELTLYSFKTDKKTGEIFPVLEDKHNHVIDSVRYAVENVRRGQYRMLEVV